MLRRTSIITSFLILSSLFQLPSGAQQTTNMSKTAPCQSYEFMENFPQRCSMLFDEWAKTHPAAAAELQRRQSMDEDWVQKYPEANAEIHNNLLNIKNWAAAHPDTEREIQEFRAKCSNILMQK